MSSYLDGNFIFKISNKPQIISKLKEFFITGNQLNQDSLRQIIYSDLAEGTEIENEINSRLDSIRVNLSKS